MVGKRHAAARELHCISWLKLSPNPKALERKLFRDLLTPKVGCYTISKMIPRNGRVSVDEDEIEAVARALYDTLECARGWEREPKPLKERLLDSARALIGELDFQRQITTARSIPPLVVSGDIRDVREFLMHSPDVSVLGTPSSHSCRVVLQGTKLTIAAANDSFFRSVGRGGFVGLPGREAFPELMGQGYFELLDQVYQTKKPFVGFMMPILFQPKKGAPLEEHITDFVYRPIEDDQGQVTGLFIESYDRTEWARASSS